MSRTTIYAFPTAGPCAKLVEFGNSWGGAAYVWTALSERYLDNSSAWLRDGNAVWSLADDRRLPPFERLTLGSTFDRFLVRRDHFGELAGAYRKFVHAHPPSDRVCHLPAMASILEDLAVGRRHGLDFTPEAIGWYWTSVAEDLWYVRTDEEAGEGRMYDLALDAGHHWLHEFDFDEE